MKRTRVRGERSKSMPTDVSLWAPVPFEDGSRITLQHDPTRHCILLTPEQATALGLRLIQCAARKVQQRIDRKLREAGERRAEVARFLARRALRRQG